jgi:hypothetical protein
MAQCSWWDLFCMSACALIYDLRAIGAAAWWLSCVHILPVS